MKQPEGIFSFGREALIQFVPFDHAKEFLKPEITREEWDKDVTPLNRETVVEQIKDYMTFAWGKVENHRGLSASRSVSKMQAWLWLLGDEGKIDWDNYSQYGAPILSEICKLYGLPIPDNTFVANMIKGELCGSYDGCGCGN
jgi:hypothetical protein